MVEEHFLNNAEGTFLWVSMAVKELEKVSSFKTKEALEKLPKGLDSMYRRILSDIDDVQVAKDILSWVTFTFRPLTLQELYVTCKLADGSDEDARDMDLQYVSDCIGICRSILTVQDGKVIFVHQSAKDFLLSLEGGGPFFMSPKDTHAKIANSCMDDITQYFSCGISLVQTYIQYSGIHWPRHAALSSGSTCPSFNSEHSLLIPPRVPENGTWGRWLAYLRASEHFSLKTPTGSTPLHIAATWGILDLAKYISKNPVLVRLWLGRQDSEGNMALHMACHSWKYTSIQTRERIIRLLLETGAEVNARGGVNGSALQAASSGGHEKIVELLLATGADVNAQGGIYGNALQAASFGGHEKIVELLLETGAEVDAQGGLFGTALQAASFAGHEGAVKFLLENGADANAPGGEFKSALEAASFRGHGKIMILLEKGVGGQCSGELCGNALQVSTEQGHENIEVT